MGGTGAAPLANEKKSWQTGVGWIYIVNIKTHTHTHTHTHGLTDCAEPYTVTGRIRELTVRYYSARLDLPAEVGLDVLALFQPRFPIWFLRC